MNFQTTGWSASRDERGLISVQVPMFVDSLADTMTVSGGSPYGLPEVGRQISQIEGAGYQVVITYEGSEGQAADDEEGTYEFDSSFREEPIESHPQWPVIKARFGGSVQDDKAVFPETLPRAQISTYGLTGNEPDAQVKNPMFGVRTYLALYVVFRRTYVRRAFPRHLLDSVGTTREKLPRGLPTPKGRNWLVQPPKISKRGDSWEIAEEWTLSKPGEKWPPAIYRYIAR